MKWAYYNEIDAAKAEWLRELMKAGAIAEGEIDERSIVDVSGDDLRSFERCHFFAGIGVWDYALNLAGWSGPCWTLSPPCPAFSAAGKGLGFTDARHLWPAAYRLIRESRPPVCFIEQVDAAIGHGWLDVVQTDLEDAHYACGKAVLPACSVGAPHKRNRLFIVAESATNGRQYGAAFRGIDGTRAEPRECWCEPRANGVAGILEHSAERRRGIGGDAAQQGRSGHVDGAGESGGVAHYDGERFAERKERNGKPDQPGFDASRGDDAMRCGPTRGFWADCDWISCRDGKWRPVERWGGATEPAPFGMADVSPADLGCMWDPREGYIVHPLQNRSFARVLRLRGYGDAIVAEVAAEFIRAYMECK